MYGKMLIIQFSCNFKKKLKKFRNSFCGYLNQIKQSFEEKKQKRFLLLEKKLSNYKFCTQILIFCLSYVVVLHKNWIFFPFLLINFFNEAKNSYFLMMMMMRIAFWAEVGYSSSSFSVCSRRNEATSPGFVQRFLGVRVVGFVVQLNRWAVVWVCSW